MYIPKPKDTSAIKLADGLKELLEELAENTHDIWAQQRIAEGWRYGPLRNDRQKEHPNLVPYKQLPESEKDYDRKTALETIKMMQTLGYTVTRPEQLPSDPSSGSLQAGQDLASLREFLDAPDAAILPSWSPIGMD